MSYTKRQFVYAAFEELGIASYVFDLQPEDLQSCLKKLDSMMASWNGIGIRVSYPLPSSPQDSDLDTDTTVPDAANEAIITNLAIKIAPSYGKSVSVDTKVAAKSSYNILLARATLPAEMQMPNTTPRGAGNKPWAINDNPFVNSPVANVQVGNDSNLEFY